MNLKNFFPLKILFFVFLSNDTRLLDEFDMILLDTLDRKFM